MSTHNTPLTTAQIQQNATAWIDNLGRVNAGRLTELLPLFTDGEASLSAALKVIAPDKERRPALAAYQTFVKRANDAAVDAGLTLRLTVDSKKRSAPDERTTWVEGPSLSLIHI